MYARLSVSCGAVGPSWAERGHVQAVVPRRKAGMCGHVGGCRKLKDMLDAGRSCQGFPCWFLQGPLPAVPSQQVLASGIAAPTATLTQAVTAVGFGWGLFVVMSSGCVAAVMHGFGRRRCLCCQSGFPSIEDVCLCWLGT